MTLDFWSSSLHLQIAEIIGVYQQTLFYVMPGTKPRATFMAM